MREQMTVDAQKVLFVVDQYHHAPRSTFAWSSSEVAAVLFDSAGARQSFSLY